MNNGAEGTQVGTSEANETNASQEEAPKVESSEASESPKVEEKPKEEEAKVEEDAKKEAPKEDSSEKELDPEEPISYKAAKQLRSEHQTLRAANKELGVQNEELRAKVTALETAARESLVSSVISKFNLEAKHAKYLSGETVEELEKSASEVAGDLGRTAPVNYENLNSGNDSRNLSSLAGKTDEEILQWAYSQQ